jgi:hypothetical protein
VDPAEWTSLADVVLFLDFFFFDLHRVVIAVDGTGAATEAMTLIRFSNLDFLEVDAKISSISELAGILGVERP